MQYYFLFLYYYFILIHVTANYVQEVNSVLNQI